MIYAHGDVVECEINNSPIGNLRDVTLRALDVLNVSDAGEFDARFSEIRGDIHADTGNVEAATAVGRMLAEKAVSAGVESVAFDRSGFRYHGRVKAFADAAREGGLKF